MPLRADIAAAATITLERSMNKVATTAPAAATAEVDAFLLCCTLCCGLHRFLLQMIEVVQPAEGVGTSRVKVGEKPKLIVFIHGGAWGSGATW